MPYVIAVHMKQATSILLFILPFTLVDMLGVKMVPLMFLISIIYLGTFDRLSRIPPDFVGIEGIAAQVEQPFGSSVSRKQIGIELMSVTHAISTSTSFAQSCCASASESRRPTKPS